MRHGTRTFDEYFHYLNTVLNLPHRMTCENAGLFWHMIKRAANSLPIRYGDELDEDRPPFVYSYGRFLQYHPLPRTHNFLYQYKQQVQKGNLWNSSKNSDLHSKLASKLQACTFIHRADTHKACNQINICPACRFFRCVLPEYRDVCLRLEGKKKSEYRIYRMQMRHRYLHYHKSMERLQRITADLQHAREKLRNRFSKFGIESWSRISFDNKRTFKRLTGYDTLQVQLSTYLLVSKKEVDWVKSELRWLDNIELYHSSNTKATKIAIREHVGLYWSYPLFMLWLPIFRTENFFRRHRGTKQGHLHRVSGLKQTKIYPVNRQKKDKKPVDNFLSTERISYKY